MLSRPLRHRTWMLAGLLLALCATDAFAYRHRGRRYRYYPSFHFAYAPGFYPSYGFGYAHFPFSISLAFAGGPKDDRPSLRVRVEPRDTEVYVDGYYAGIVDDFDGSRQKLKLEPGPHTITLVRDGYRDFEQTVNPSHGTTVVVRHQMEPLPPGTAVTPPPAAGVPRPAPAPPAPPTASLSTEYGTLSVRARPGDVEIWIDGVRWEIPSGAERLDVTLAPGVYPIEVLKDGYQPFRSDVTIAPGETSALNVQLTPG